MAAMERDLRGSINIQCLLRMAVSVLLRLARGWRLWTHAVLSHRLLERQQECSLEMVDVIAEQTKMSKVVHQLSEDLNSANDRWVKAKLSSWGVRLRLRDEGWELY